MNFKKKLFKLLINFNYKNQNMLIQKLTLSYFTHLVNLQIYNY